MADIPREMTGPFSNTPLGVEWNKMVRYLRSIRPVSSVGSNVNQTPFGTATTVEKRRGEGQLVFLPVCKADGSRVYVGLKVFGIYEENTGTVYEPTAIADTIPDNSLVLE